MLLRYGVIFCLAISGMVHAQDYADMQFSVQPGPHPVGVKVVEQYDGARTFGPPQVAGAPHAGRPLQTIVWYPARKSARATLTMGDYLALMDTEVSFGDPQSTHDSELVKSWLKDSLNQHLSAVGDAAMESGKYPTVIYSPSFSSSPFENADLCEYLASYGYVVVSSPAMGEQSRDSTHDLAGVNAQAKDISFLIDYAATLPDVDIAKLAAIGFSWGGLADLFAAAQDHRIAALVSLDGSERYFAGLVQASGTVRPGEMRIPLLYFAEGDASLEGQDKLNSRFHDDGPSVLNQWVHGDLLTVRMLGLFHPEFCSAAYRNRVLWEQELPNLQIADYDRADGMTGYAWVLRYTKAFLDFHLKADAPSGSFLKATPAANGVPKHTMSIRFRPADPVAASPAVDSR